MADSRWADFIEQMRAFVAPGREGAYACSLEGDHTPEFIGGEPHPHGTVRLGERYLFERREYYLNPAVGGEAGPGSWGFLRTAYPAEGSVQIIETYRGGYAHKLTAPRPLSIALRSAVETRFISQAHLESDQRVGAEGFDAQVFVQAVAEDETLAQVLASEGAREAVLALLGLGCALLVIDDGQGFVTARLEGEAMPEQTEGLAERVLAAMQRLVFGLPGFVSAP